jgi:hypothetical protein
MAIHGLSVIDQPTQQRQQKQSTIFEMYIIVTQEFVEIKFNFFRFVQLFSIAI